MLKKMIEKGKVEKVISAASSAPKKWGKDRASGPAGAAASPFI
jgi:hypothetical protein